MLNSGLTVDLSVWKANGEIMNLKNCVSLHYDYYGGWRNVKLLASGAVRKIRDVCIFQIDDEEVYI